MKMTGNKFLIEALKKEGVEYVFGYQGACVMDIFDELYKQDEMEVILPRHEQGLTHAADGYARATGKVGVCLATSGPGATNLVSGIATANYDSVPLVCFTGQVPRFSIGNDAFQEVDIIGITRSICKYGVTVRDRKDLGRIIKEAFYIARTGKPGPVVIDLPKDVMQEIDDTPYPEEVNIRGYKPAHESHVGQIKRAIRELNKSKRPLFLIGGGVTRAHAEADFTKLVDLTEVPVVTTIMGKGAVPTDHPLYVGNLGMHGCYAANLAVNECDLLFAIGTRFNDRITGKLQEFAPNATIIHIDIDTSAISRNVHVDIPIVADANEAIGKLLSYAKPHRKEKWIAQVDTWKAEDPVKPVHDKPGLNPYTILEAVNTQFDEAIVVTDVGQHQMWTTQCLKMNDKKKLLTSGGLGTMGFGFPAAIGAKLGNPDSTVICISGDGGMQMNIQELATAVCQELPVIICVLNNGYLGMVRQWQQLFYKKRYSSTCMKKRKSCEENCGNPDFPCPAYSPDFIKVAESYGAYGIRVTKEEGIKEAFEQAKANIDAPTIIEFIIETEELVLPMVKGGSSLVDMIL